MSSDVQQPGSVLTRGAGIWGGGVHGPGALDAGRDGDHGPDPREITSEAPDGEGDWRPVFEARYRKIP